MGATRILRVRDWSENYENNRSRELKKLDWLALPNKQDGDGYTELLDHPSGAAHFGAWIAIVQVASKCDPRGTLLRDRARPHDSASLSRITRIPSNVLDEAISRLISIGWLEVLPTDTTYVTSDTTNHPAPSCENPAPACGKAPIHYITEQDRTQHYTVGVEPPRDPEKPTDHHADQARRIADARTWATNWLAANRPDLLRSHGSLMELVLYLGGDKERAVSEFQQVEKTKRDIDNPIAYALSRLKQQSKQTREIVDKIEAESKPIPIKPLPPPSRPPTGWLESTKKTMAAAKGGKQ